MHCHEKLNHGVVLYRVSLPSATPDRIGNGTWWRDRIPADWSLLSGKEVIPETDAYGKGLFFDPNPLD